MAKISVFDKRFKHVGTYHWRDFIATIRGWGEERGFTVLETTYKEKVPEIEVEFLGERKRDEYLADYFTVSMHLWAVTDVGDGIIRSRGEYRVTSWMETGYQDLYGNAPMTEGWLEKLDAFFRKHVLRMHIDLKIADPYYYETLELTRTLQNMMGMELSLTRAEELA